MRSGSVSIVVCDLICAMPENICPICGKPLSLVDAPRGPFCSDRCRQVDLGRWLGERYRVSASVTAPAEPSTEWSEPADED